MYVDFRAKYPLFLLDCNEAWIYGYIIQKYFMKISAVGAELFHADGQI